MNAEHAHLRDESLPSLRELGLDLISITSRQRWVTMLLPPIAMLGYVGAASFDYWKLAVLSVMVLSFVTYGSTSHDLVHRTLGLSAAMSDLWLSLIELGSLRSGTAYRLTHLHHHRRTLADDDIEASSVRGTWVGSLIDGVTMQPRLWIWAWRHEKRYRLRLGFEAAGIVALISMAAGAMRWTSVPAVYVGLVIGGSWVFPLVTVYIPHVAGATDPIRQTRLFRGLAIRIIGAEHLYHLQHHLYPAVPHHNWPQLAARLDPHFCRLGVEPVLGRINHG